MDLDINILKRFFEGKYSRKDFLTIQECIENDQSDHEIRELMTIHYLEFCKSPAPDFDVELLLHKLHEQIEDGNHQEGDFNNVSGITNSERDMQMHHNLNIPPDRLTQPNPTIHPDRKMQSDRSFTKWFQRVAAILIIPVILSFLAFLAFSSKQRPEPVTQAEIQCPFGVRTKFTLPDGTTGFLNSGSTLHYSIPFNSDREVSLYGEAYFDVAKRDNKPFLVKTTKLNLKVLGTTFNVIAYRDEQSEEVILQTGKLEVLNKTGSSLCLLEPDQKFQIQTGNEKVNKSDVIASQYTSWKEGKLTFRNEDMGQVARRLSRWYNAEIVIADAQLMNYKFYATFQDEQLDQVLKLLAITSPIAFEEMKREINPDGTYEKRRIILKLNLEKIKQFS